MRKLLSKGQAAERAGDGQDTSLRVDRSSDSFTDSSRPLVNGEPYPLDFLVVGSGGRLMSPVMTTVLDRETRQCVGFRLDYVEYEA